jgi:hypothetical protein
MITFSWLDYSERERRKMLDVVHLFDEKDTIDELGLGSIRDAIADRFFPGTGTVQTRARYLFFIPWMYLALETKGVTSARIAERARSEELKLVERLLEMGNIEGVIGRVARKKLKRLPSNIYWLGLERLGFRRLLATQTNYHSYLDHYYKQLATAKDRSKEDDEMIVSPNWNSGLPQPPNDFPEYPTFKLTKAEAQFYLDQLQFYATGGLLTWLAWNGGRTENVDFIWDHPQFDDFPTNLQTEITHARLFSLAMHGAALLYNLLLAETGMREFKTEGGKWKGSVDNYRDALIQWEAQVHALEKLYTHWRMPELWTFVQHSGARFSPNTRAFIETWLEMVRSGIPAGLADTAQYRSLVEQRERQLKRGNARLGNRAALENWAGASGARQLAFRWPNARTILHDVYDGLMRED